MLEYAVEQQLKVCLTLHREGQLSVTGLAISCYCWQLTVLDLGRSSVTGIVWAELQGVEGGPVYLVDEDGLVSEVEE